MTTFFQDIRYACRSFKKSPAFTLTAVLMLAFGIGATTAIFSVVDGVLLRSLPFHQADRLVTLGDQVSGLQFGELDLVTAPEMLTYQRNLHSFSSLGGWTTAGLELSGVGQPAMIWAARMTASMFTTLGVAPLMGRVFTEQEDSERAQVAVLYYDTWKTRFDSNPNVLGTKILLSRKPYIVIGVMPKGFTFPLLVGTDYRAAELWLPMSFSPEELQPDNGWGFEMVGRLKPGVTATQAESEANGVAQETMRTLPPKLANLRIHAVVYPLQQKTVNYERSLLRLLFWPVAIVMLIACANFAGLLLVRAIRRQREMAVRLALGARARTLLWQSISESLVLSAAGGAIGIALGAFAIYAERNYLARYLVPENMPLTQQITLNWQVAGFAVLLALLTGVCCGLAPGFAALRTNMNAQMNQGGRSGSASAAHARLRSGLVVLETATALVLLSASGLLLRSFQKMNEVNLGFEPDHVVMAEYALPQQQYSTQAMVDTFNQSLLERLRQLPGVAYAALPSSLPLRGADSSTIVVEGHVNPREPETAEQTEVIGDFFRAIRIPLLRGRYFVDADDANGELVVIVNREFAEHYWPHQDPIGKRLRIGLQKMSTAWMTVVGEVGDTKLGRPDSDKLWPQFYTPVAQAEKDAGSEADPTDLNGRYSFIVVRSSLLPEQMESAIRKVVRELDPQLPLIDLRTMDEIVSLKKGFRRFNTAVISSFALAAVLLAGLGIYSIVAFSVASRAQEMAIRIALGSQPGRILRLVLISGAKLAAAGAVIGLAGAAAAAGVVRSFLFQVSPFDPAVLVLVTIAVFALALVAATIPARRAAATDPMEALRSE